MGAMARRMHRLSALAVSRAKAAGLYPNGMYADGGGLYLQVSGGARSWIFRFARAGRTRYMGLGSLGAVTLSEARARAADARRLVSAGKTPSPRATLSRPPRGLRRPRQ